MKIVKENIEFKRGAGAKASLNIGLAKKITDKLAAMYKKEIGYEYREYVYVSPEKIIIRYQKKRIGYANANKSKEPQEDYPIWIIKYAILPKYEATSISEKGSTWIDERTTYNFAGILEKRIPNTEYPGDMKVVDEVMMKMTIENKKGGKEEANKKCEIMADALNEKLPPMEGFLLVDQMEVSVEKYEAKVKELSRNI